MRSLVSWTCTTGFPVLGSMMLFSSWRRRDMSCCFWGLLVLFRVMKAKFRVEAGLHAIVDDESISRSVGTTLLIKRPRKVKGS